MYPDLGMQSYVLCLFLHSFIQHNTHRTPTTCLALGEASGGHRYGIPLSKTKGPNFSLQVSLLCPISDKVTHGHILLNNSPQVLWILWGQPSALGRLLHHLPDCAVLSFPESLLCPPPPSPTSRTILPREQFGRVVPFLTISSLVSLHSVAVPPRCGLCPVLFLGTNTFPSHHSEQYQKPCVVP